jgi:hypothetical protein
MQDTAASPIKEILFRKKNKGCTGYPVNPKDTQ